MRQLAAWSALMALCVIPNRQARAQTAADSTDIRIAAIASMKLTLAGWRVIFDDGSGRRSQPTAETKRLLDRFHFANATAADLAKCGNREHACAVLPDSTVLIDVSDLVVNDTKATVTVRSTSATHRRDGTLATNSSMLSVMMTREKNGWKVTGGVARASDVGGR